MVTNPRPATEEP